MAKRDHLWDVEIAYWIKHRGLDPDKARTLTIIRWMWHGDLHPLVAAIEEKDPLDQPVLDTLAVLCSEGRLIVKPPRRRKPKPPAKFARDMLAALLYENRTTAKSDDAFNEIASTLFMSHQSVRDAVTRWRKTNAK